MIFQPAHNVMLSIFFLPTDHEETVPPQYQDVAMKGIAGDTPSIHSNNKAPTSHDTVDHHVITNNSDSHSKIKALEMVSYSKM